MNLTSFHADTEKNASTIQSVERAFKVLRCIAKHPKGISLTAITKEVALARTTTLRLLTTLESEGAVERLEHNKHYCIGEAITQLTAMMPYSNQLAAIAHPHLQQLNATTGETINLCVADGHEALYLDQVSSNYHIQLQDWTGLRCPMHIVSGGKVLLAFANDQKIERYLKQPLAKYTDKSVVNPQRLREQLLVIKSQGYAITEDEFEPEMVALSAPIFDSLGKVSAAIAMGGPSYRLDLTNKKLKKNLIQQLLDTSKNISDNLSIPTGG